MKKIAILAMITVLILFLSSLLINTMGAKEDMNPLDGEKHDIGIAPDPPTLDGVVNVGASWDVSQYVGGCYIAMNASSVADVYMTVEVDENDNFEYLWIGVKPISPYYFEPAQGQWLRIDWDQDGILDYEDHTGWSVSDGADSSSGAEWMIPWGKARYNPGDTPYTMNASLIGYCFDILIHIEVDTPSSTSNSATFPSRPIPKPGMFNATTICVNLTLGPGDEDEGFGIRSKGFWKHQFKTALGGTGHQHIPTENLTRYLGQINNNTNVSDLQGLDLRDALLILEGIDSSDMYEKAVQQLLATWLNFCLVGDVEVDTDDDGVTDTMLSDAIAYVENILNDPDSTKSDLEEAKDICEIINNSGEED